MITVEDIKQDIREYNYRMITNGDDSIAERAIKRATLWCKAKVQAYGATFTDTDINREIVLKRALYELYSYAENEAVAEDKKEDAMELLKAAYTGVDATGYTSGQGGATEGTERPIVVKIKQAKRGR